MKIQYHAWWLVPAISFSTFSCKDKPEDAGKTEEGKSVLEKVVEVVDEVVTPKSDPVKASLSDEERAAKLGFAQYLPKDTQVVVSAYNAKQAAEQLKALELFKLIDKNMGGNAVIEEDFLDEEILEEDAAPRQEMAPAQEGPPSPWMLLGQEVTLAFGKNTTEQVGGLLTFNRRLAYFQALAMGRAALTFAETMSPDAFEQGLGNELGSDMIKRLFEDPESGVDLLSTMNMPTIYMAFRAKDGEVDQAAALVNSGMGMFAMAGEMVAPIELEIAGSKFSGYQILGEEIAKMMESERANMERELSSDTVTKLFDVLASRKVTIVTGVVGDYVVAMIGGEEGELTLANNIEDSLVASGELNFVDSYADKQLVSMIYGEHELAKTLIEESGGLATYALGFRDGISGGSALGDTRDIEAMFQIIADREKSLLSLGSYDDSGTIVFVEDGLKIESFGGYDKGAVDWEKSTLLSHLGDSPDNLLFLNVPSAAKYDEKLGEYAEAIFETAYAVTMKLSELEVEQGDFAEMKQYAKMFDADFREDALGIYDAISSELGEGLGNEYALVVDLGGVFPAIPGVPQPVIDEAKAPRITMVAPVESRESLASAWTNIDSRTSSLLTKVSEMVGQNIPMQKPMSSDKDGMTTWFFPLPFFQDDFMPSVTLNDDWFAASTSKIRAVDLIGKATEGGEKSQGINFHMNFEALTAYSEEMFAMVEKNAEQIFPNEFQMRDFNRNKADIKDLIKAAEDFKSLNWSVRREDGLVRGSMHFQMK